MKDGPAVAQPAVAADCSGSVAAGRAPAAACSGSAAVVAQPAVAAACSGSAAAVAGRAVAFLPGLAFQACLAFRLAAPAVRGQERWFRESKNRTAVLITWARFMMVASMASLDVAKKIN